jgi:hypothetical protein
MAAPFDREKFAILFGAGFFGAHVVSLLPRSRWFGSAQMVDLEVLLAGEI